MTYDITDNNTTSQTTYNITDNNSHKKGCGKNDKGCRKITGRDQRITQLSSSRALFT